MSSLNQMIDLSDAHLVGINGGETFWTRVGQLAGYELSFWKGVYDGAVDAAGDVVNAIGG